MVAPSTRRVRRSSKRLMTLLGGGLLLIGGGPIAHGQVELDPDVMQKAVEPTSGYHVVDNLQASWTGLNAVPFRPMVIDPAGLPFFAVNVHDSTVHRFDFLNGNPTQTWRVPWNPVSLALFDSHPDGVSRLLVVCRGTHCLLILDRETGQPLEWLDLPHEPADLLVDDFASLAFVSSTGKDQVVEIDLLSPAILRTFDIPAQHPAFLSFDAAGDVLVAPMMSGNNSTVLGDGEGASFIQDLDDPSVAPAGGLPDEDLFRIVRSTGAVEPILRGTGTILFGHGLNPADGKFWQLNLESKNKTETKQSEPAVQGIFSENRLTISTLPPVGGPIVSNHLSLNLDDTDHATEELEVDETRTISLPWAMDFDAAGNALVVGIATDNILALNSAGDFLLEWDLPAGSLPRQVLFDPLVQHLCLVYCWGTNKLLLFTLLPVFDPVPVEFDLGYDPAPSLVQQGRQVFYDATHSLNNNLTCAHCHIDGGMDLLSWNISDLPKDDKGPMFTQTLFNIENRAPFHWRGERRTLLDFNVAFPGLLGADGELDDSPGGLFDQFQAFVFSLMPPANPFQDERRILNDEIAELLPNGRMGSAVQGQDDYQFIPSDGPFSCADCHTLPTGTNNDFVFEEFGPKPQQTHIETPHFVDLWRKLQPQVPVELSGGTVMKPLTGFNFVHTGGINSLFDFVHNIFQQVSPQQRANIIEFVNQFDSGHAPAIHKGVLLDTAHFQQAKSRLKQYLIPQARSGNCDLVVFGNYPLRGAPEQVAWVYDPVTKRFLSEDSTAPTVSFTDFLQETQAHGLSNLFFGVPVGNGIGKAIDWDRDGLRNFDEATHNVDPWIADSDSDTFLDGHEVEWGSEPDDDTSLPVDTVAPRIDELTLDWKTARNASITFRTSEPCQVKVTYSTAASGISELLYPALQRVHRVILTDMLPSTELGTSFDVKHTYSGTITVTDNAGQETSVPLPGFATDPFTSLFSPVLAIPATVIGTLGFRSENDLGGGVLELDGQARVDFRLAGPPAIPAEDFVVIGNILVNGTLWTDIDSSPSEFDVLGERFDDMPGPFVLSTASLADGMVDFDVTVNGLSSGDDVRFNVIAVMYADPDTYDPWNPDFGSETNNLVPAGNWSFPDTLKEMRGVETTY